MGTVLKYLINDYTRQLEAKDTAGDHYVINDALSLSEFIDTVKRELET